MVAGASGLESSLERELKAWRETRSREQAAIAIERSKVFPSASPVTASASSEGRRVRVNGQEVLVVSRARRTFA